MNARPSSMAWNPIRAFAALFVAATVLGGTALVAAFALVFATLVLNTGGLIFQALVAGIKVLGPVVVAIVILTSGLLGFCRSAQA